MEQGDFSDLATTYARYRPGYAASVVTTVLGLVDRPTDEIEAVDIGAGTGIFSRALAERGLAEVTAVEPNDAMRAEGERGAHHENLRWKPGSGEHVPLDDRSVDLASAASCFHWFDFEAATAEIARVLRPGGRFIALWNPRLIEANPLLVDIEAKLTELHPGLERKSSGRSGITAELTDRLWGSEWFDDVVTVEARHVVEQSPAHHRGAWESVNDVQAQLGPDRFARFLAYVDERTADVDRIDVTYLTRAWIARRRS